MNLYEIRTKDEYPGLYKSYYLLASTMPEAKTEFEQAFSYYDDPVERVSNTIPGSIYVRCR